ncbi:MAG: FAD/NAD(P)-binding protein [Rhizobium sp.]|nr:FAD/NAD(P)-binding protein [Rhizobium sp.]
MLRITMSIPQTARVSQPSPSRIAIVGGGFTGAIIAYHLVNRSHHSVDEITVFEPRTDLGAGLAYSTNDPALRLNVAAYRMRAVPGDPGAFAQWLQATGRLSLDTQSISRGGTFARRRDFGAFMAERLSPLTESGQIRHVVEKVTSMDRASGEWRLVGSGGSVVTADLVVIATGHAPPRVPDQVPAHLVRAGRCLPATRLDAASDTIRTDERILVVGAGLTALDVVASLQARQHKGTISILSRTGLLPRPHADGDFSPFGRFDDSPATARGLLRKVRSLIAEVTEDGLPWQSVMDALRHQGQAIWAGLPRQEKRRVLRHLRRWYEVHRFRMPPQIEALLATAAEASAINFLSGRLKRVVEQGQNLAVEISTGNPARTCRLDVDRIITATGPDQANLLDYQPFLKSLRDAGTLTPDGLGLGIPCDDQCRAIASNGHPQASLLIAGPLTRGTFGEITGVPEIAAQAGLIVDTILRWTASQTRTIEIRGRAAAGIIG